MAVVKVGAAGTEYKIHKALLSEHSEYFKRALNGPWKESQEGVVRLEDISCGICKSSSCTQAPVLTWSVDIFVDWLYTRKLPSDYYEWAAVRDENCQGDKDEDTMMKATALAHRLLAPKFLKAMEHAVILEFFEFANTPCSANTIVFAFDNLPSSSPILRLLVDDYCFHYTEEIHSEREDKYPGLPQLPHHFLLRVLFRHSEMRENPSRRTQAPCGYHNHIDAGERKVCEKLMDAQSTLRNYGD
jgi:hypothetical protein